MQDVKLILDSEKCMSRMSLPQETHHTYLSWTAIWRCFNVLALYPFHQPEVGARQQSDRVRNNHIYIYIIFIDLYIYTYNIYNI
jgi:hypothetical protein